MSKLRSLDDALAELLGFAQVLPGVETLATFVADGRVLAQDLVAELQVPPQDNSAMDGYALRCADFLPHQALPVSQRIPAGSPAQALVPNSVARIFTGAPLPTGADAVVQQEDTQVLSDGRVQINRAPRPSQWIRRAGEDVPLHAVVLQRGVRLTPAALGLAASIGAATLSVRPRPRVALFSTGNELVMPGTIAPAHMPLGAIYNSNRFFLHALLQRLGCVVSDLGIVPDRPDATLAALQNAAQSHDVILTSGGVSVGEEDHIKAAVQSLGTLHLWQLAIKPGKPFAYGHVQGAHFMGLPGNPVSSFVTFLLLVRPFLLALQGAENLPAPALTLPAHFAWPKPDKRREFLRVRRNANGGLDLFANQSSGVLTSLVWADGVVDNPPGQTIQPGDAVSFLPWTQMLT
jgi:molybdopterin molybdotransferase